MITREDRELIEKVVEFETKGAYSVRKNSNSVEVHSTDEVEINRISKDHVEFIVKPNSGDIVLAVPAIVTESDVEDKVTNVFKIGENTNCLILAGCAISNDSGTSSHSGLHMFILGKNSKVKYIEQHIGEGKGHRKMVTKTSLSLDDGSEFVMDSTQIEGIDYAERETTAVLGQETKLDVKEKLMTFSDNVAKSSYEINLDRNDSKVNIVSRSVAVEESYQEFISNIYGNAKCYGRVECDAIVKDDAVVDAIPRVRVNDSRAELSHEATIGRIAGEQLMKLMTIGLTKEEAELEIINAFLR